MTNKHGEAGLSTMRTKMKLMKPLATQNTAVSNLHRGHNYKCTSSVNSGPSQKKKKTTTTTAYRDVENRL